MVQVTFFQNKQQDVVGFVCEGHAGFAESQDIVCAGVSALVITCVNSIEALTEDRFVCSTDEETGRVDLRMVDGCGAQSQLLLMSLALGLEEMEESYPGHIDVTFEEG